RHLHSFSAWMPERFLDMLTLHFSTLSIQAILQSQESIEKPSAVARPPVSRELFRESLEAARSPPSLPSHRPEPTSGSVFRWEELCLSASSIRISHPRKREAACSTPCAE